jgi:hypothetical protein
MAQLLNIGNQITAGTDPYQFYNFRERVLADGATILSDTQVSEEIKRLRSLGLFSKFSALYTPAVRNTSKLYSIVSADGDATVTRGSVKNVIDADGDLEQIASNVTPSSFGTGGWGALVEGDRANSIRNNTMAGAVVGTVGSGGSLPTNWAIPTTAGLTTDVLSIDNINGVTYATIRMFGTASANAGNLVFESNTEIAASAGQVWTNSYWFDIVAQPNPAVQYQRYIAERTVVGGFVNAGASTISNVGERGSFTRTLSGGTTERVNAGFQFTLVSGQSYDFTVRIGLPQMEQGNFASSVMKTSSGAFTRPIDAIEDTGAPELTTGGIYALADLRLLSQTRTIKASGTDASNGYFILVTSTNRIRMEVRVSGVVTGSVETGTITAGLRKMAGLWAPSGIALYVDGVAIGTAVPSSLPASTATTSIGSDFGAVALFDRLTLCGVINDGLTNSQAIALTT